MKREASYAVVSLGDRRSQQTISEFHLSELANGSALACTRIAVLAMRRNPPVASRDSRELPMSRLAVFAAIPLLVASQLLAAQELAKGPAPSTVSGAATLDTSTKTTSSVGSRSAASGAASGTASNTTLAADALARARAARPSRGGRSRRPRCDAARTRAPRSRSHPSGRPPGTGPRHAPGRGHQPRGSCYSPCQSLRHSPRFSTLRSKSFSSRCPTLPRRSP